MLKAMEMSDPPVKYLCGQVTEGWLARTLDKGGLLQANIVCQPVSGGEEGRFPLSDPNE